MKFLLLSIMVISVSGCDWLHHHGFNNKTACDIANVGAGAGTVAVGSVLGCSGVEAMVSDMQNMLVANTHICTTVKPASGAVADLICPAVVDYLTSTALKGLPSAWNCKGTALTDFAKNQIITVCRATVPY